MSDNEYYSSPESPERYSDSEQEGNNSSESSGVSEKDLTDGSYAEKLDNEDAIPSDQSEEDEVEVLLGNFQPYQDEPLADSEEESEEENNEEDEDGLTPEILASRFDRQVLVNSWYVEAKIFLTYLPEEFV
jgi:hypothetical protein